MPRKAGLYEAARGSPLEGYFLLRGEGKNVPRSWFQRAAVARRTRHGPVAEALRQGNWSKLVTLRDWEQAYLKERFYYGVRVLLELERNGMSDL